jgi:hypothetical protein
MERIKSIKRINGIKRVEHLFRLPKSERSKSVKTVNRVDGVIPSPSGELERGVILLHYLHHITRHHKDDSKEQY